MLLIEDLKVEVGGKVILKNVNMEISEGETHILFGPNGSGKTSLMMTIIGFSGYEVTRGKIIFKNKDITYMPIYERARLGIGVSFQKPPAINGLSTRKIAELCAEKNNKKIELEKLAEQVNMIDFLERDINRGFSGGEIKRAELLQLMAQKPDLLLLDEPESGVDLENISLVGETINNLLDKKKNSALIITHTGNILDYVTADKGQVLYDGVLRCSQNPKEILKWIREYGYRECVTCTKNL